MASMRCHAIVAVKDLSDFPGLRIRVARRVGKGRDKHAASLGNQEQRLMLGRKAGGGGDEKEKKDPGRIR